MNHPASIPSSQSPARLPLRGPRLHLIRAAWIGLALFSLVLFLRALPAHIIYISSGLPIDAKIALYQMGRTVNFYIYFETVHVLIIAFDFMLTALAIFLRRSDDGMAIFVSVTLLTFGVAISPSLETVPVLFSLVNFNQAWLAPVIMLYGLGIGLMLLVFYLFPDGRFVPHWTRPVSYVWFAWLTAFILLPEKGVGVVEISPIVRFIIRIFALPPEFFLEFSTNLRYYSLLIILVFWFGSGVFAQIYRYTRVSSPAQRHQTKWVVYGLSAGTLLYFGAHLPLPFLQAGGATNLELMQYQIWMLPVTTLGLLLIPLSISIAMLRYRLWDVDFIINRTLVYGGLTGLLGAVYFGAILVIQGIFNRVAGYNSTIIIAITTLAVASLFRPLRQNVQDLIDRRFYREKVNFRQAFTDFARQVRTIIDLPELLRVLVDRTTEMLHIEYGAVFLRELTGAFWIAESHDLPWEQFYVLLLNEKQLDRLQAGQVISQPKDPRFPMLVPLVAPRTSNQTDAAPPLLGVLALGPMRSGLHYRREDQALLLSLAEQAGTAIYVARLIQEAQAEVRRREEAEERLQAYRNSPMGRAEAMATEILGQPEMALSQLHRLAGAAGKDPNIATLVGNLPKVLENLDAGPVAGLAEGFQYIFSSQYTAELLPIGLRTLITALANQANTIPVKPSSQKEGGAESRPAPGEAVSKAAEAIALYELCQSAYNANSIAQITCLKYVGYQSEEESLQANSSQDPLNLSAATFLNDLARALAELRPASDALHAYERVDTTQDKLAYLARAINHLRHVDYLARAELNSADRPVIQRIVESWTAIVASAMSELQTSARIVCQLLTRNTWQGDIVSLVLALQNQGKGAATEIKVSLAPSPEYTLLEEAAYVERLAPGEEAQVHLRVRPRLDQIKDQFRARFTILYSDPRGPDQVENFADEVHILSATSDFHFIPNPYVVGTPLQTGSPLFFGREDVVRFVQENLAAQHRNNLVLIGQRRTGKTSLLKQIPARLDDNYLPVYVDGQTLGLDPGLPNFFLTLATEIAFAMEDRGFEIDPPEIEEFALSPAATFERVFLADVRKKIGDRHLLIMFDEFEELEAAIKRGHLEASIFGFLRHIIQHSQDLSVIFCGTHRIEELAADYWNILFNISLYHHIAFLDHPEALRLIQEPVALFGMRYDDLALDKMWRVTAGHPYFLQLLCHSLVNRHNKIAHSYMTIADVNAALDEILASGEAHFVYLWAESTPVERLALTALSRLTPLTGQATTIQLMDFLIERGISVERQAISEALHHLALRDILSANRDVDSGMGEAYQWRLGLLGLWVEKYKSLSRVVDEVRL